MTHMLPEEQVKPEGTMLRSLVLVQVGKQTLTFEDLIAELKFQGWWEDEIRHLRHVHETFAAFNDGGLDIDPHALQYEADSFRYRESLITAEETTAWLQERFLEFEDLNMILAGACAEAPEEDRRPPNPFRASNKTKGRYELSEDEAIRLFWADCHIRNRWGEFWTGVLFRHVVWEGQLTGSQPSRSQVEDEKDRFAAKLPRQIPLERWLVLNPEVKARLIGLCKREVAYREYSESILTDENYEKRLAARRPDLVHVQFELTYCQTEDIAREAYLCVKVDKESLKAVCERASIEYKTGEAYIEDMEADLAPYLLSAEAGEIVEPVPAGDECGYWLALIRDKLEPSLDDPEIAERIRVCVIQHVFQPYLQTHVSWPLWQLLKTS